MRILFITHFFPPTHNAGTENYTLGIAKAFQFRGHEVQVLCAEGWEVGDSYWNGVTDETYEKVPVRRLHLNWKKAPDPNKVLYDSKIVETWISHYLEAASFDIVHITSAYSLGVGMMRSAKSAQVPLVLTLTDFWFLCPSLQLMRSNGELCNGMTTAPQCQSCMMHHTRVSQGLARIGMPYDVQARLWTPLSYLPSFTRRPGFRGKLLNMDERKELLRAAIKLPDLLLTPSETVQAIFAYHTDRNIKLQRYGHDLSWLKNYHGKSPSEKLRIGYIGQIIPIKGPHVLVAAFRMAGFSGDATLSIWGSLQQDLNYVDRLRSMIANDPSISLCGHFEHDDLADILANIDVLVVPSLWYENTPLVIQEAFAAKTPVIATKLAGMAEVVSHGTNGLLFELGNIDDLSGQLRHFAADADLRQRLVAGIKAVKKVEEEVVELEENYHNLMKRSKHIA